MQNIIAYTECLSNTDLIIDLHTLPKCGIMTNLKYLIISYSYRPTKGDFGLLCCNDTKVGWRPGWG